MASCLSFFSILFVAVAVVQAEQCKQATDCSWEGNYLVARIWKAIDRNGGVTMQATFIICGCIYSCLRLLSPLIYFAL